MLYFETLAQAMTYQVFFSFSLLWLYMPSFILFLTIVTLYLTHDFSHHFDLMYHKYNFLTIYFIFRYCDVLSAISHNLLIYLIVDLQLWLYFSQLCFITCISHNLLYFLQLFVTIVIHVIITIITSITIVRNKTNEIFCYCDFIAHNYFSYICDFV